MNRIDRFIVDCPSFEQFCTRLSVCSKKEKGDFFERLVQVYLKTAPIYRDLKEVWLLGKTPPSDLAALGLPTHDIGIDLIAQHKNGKYWVIQAKDYEENASVGWGRLATFNSARAVARDKIDLALVAHTTRFGRSANANI
jgi:predicted helicase